MHLIPGLSAKRSKSNIGHNNHGSLNDQNSHNGYEGHNGQDGFDSQYGDDSYDKFNAPGQVGKGLILLKDSCWLMLAWFFIFSNADIRFAGKKLVWMTYTTANDQAGGTLRSQKTCGCSPRGL